MVGGMLLRFKWVIFGGEFLVILCVGIVLLLINFFLKLVVMNGILIFIKFMVVVVLKKYGFYVDKGYLIIWVDVMRL